MEKTNKILVGIIVILLLVVIYALVLKPASDDKATENQQIGVNFAIATIMQQVATCQVVPLIFGNQTINIIAIDCLPPELFNQPTETEE